MAIRAALGAGQRRLLRQLATEAVVLSAIGGAAGLLVAMWTIDLLPASILTRLPQVREIRLDRTVLFVALASTLLTSVMFGLAPALQLARPGRVAQGARRGRRCTQPAACARGSPLPKSRWPSWSWPGRDCWCAASSR